jgi:hypothetical protein
MTRRCWDTTPSVTRRRSQAFTSASDLARFTSSGLSSNMLAAGSQAIDQLPMCIGWCEDDHRPDRPILQYALQRGGRRERNMSGNLAQPLLRPRDRPYDVYSICKLDEASHMRCCGKAQTD